MKTFLCGVVLALTTLVIYGQARIPGDDVGPTPSQSVLPVPSMQTFSPTSGSTVNIAATNAYAIFVKLTPSSLLSALTITMPTGDHQGQKIYITSTQGITLLTLSPPSGGSVIGSLVLYAVNGFSAYYWDGANWVRCG